MFENKIYCIGGFAGLDGDLTGVNEVYDPATDTWETKTSMPTPRGGLKANSINGKIYLISGSTNVNEVYDPSADTWTAKTPPPTRVSQYVSAVVDSKIYLIGGSGTKLNQIYNPETDTWSNGSPIPIAYPGVATATSGVFAPKKIYALGRGFILSGELNQVYDPENDSWSTGSAMLTARAELGVAVIDDRLYAIGGGNGVNSYFSGANEEYTPIGYRTPDIPHESSPYPTDEPSNITTSLLIFVIAATATAVVVGAGLIIYFKRRHIQDKAPSA